jgi:hypothetical protein
VALSDILSNLVDPKCVDLDNQSMRPSQITLRGLEDRLAFSGVAFEGISADPKRTEPWPE